MYVTKKITAGNQWTDPLFLSEFYNYSAQTAEPTIVLQPETPDPIIVPPVIVQPPPPVIVNPVIVTP